MQAVGQDAAAMLPQLHLFHGDRDKVEESKLKSSNRFRLWGWKQAWNNTTHFNINTEYYAYQHIKAPSARYA